MTRRNEDADESSDDYEVYEPQRDDRDLEVEEEAYNVLEYVSLDWPAQSIDTAPEFNIVLGTNPVGEEPRMVRIDLSQTDGLSKPEEMRICKRSVDESYNKVRVRGDLVYCMSDTKVVVHGLDLEEVYRRGCDEELGYGLCFSDGGFMFGTRDGSVSVNDWECREVSRMRIHEGSVEGLCNHGGILFSASCDHSVSLTDIRTKERVFQRRFGSDINAIDFNGDNTVVFGDDEGIVRVMDIRNNGTEELRRHKSPVSCVRWRDREVFVSGSDEQVCIWDTTLDGTEESGYLLFVHQGQKFYKDIGFCKEKYVVTTSIDGLCVFYPISFEEQGGE